MNIALGEEGGHTQETNCHNHGEQITLYCTSCEEAICRECRVTGPHDSTKHDIATIGDTV